MHHVFRCLLGFVGCWLLAAGVVQGQGVGYGDWQLHLPTNHPLSLADADDRVYVATENAFYYLDKAQNTTQVLTRRDGLSDVGVAGAAYDSVTRQTVIAYRNTNLDIILPNGRVRNLSDVLRKSVQGAKVVYRVSMGNKRAYLSTSFGLVVIDLVKLEISDTYANIGAGGTAVAVYDAAEANGFLYVACSEGMLRGAVAANLLDYRAWTRSQPPAGLTYRYVAAYAGQVYAAADGGAVATRGVYRYAAGAWQLVPNTGTNQFNSLRSSGAGVLIADTLYGVRRIDRNNVVNTVVSPPAGQRTVNDAVRSSRDGSYYIANYKLGLLRVRPGSGQADERFVANGPESALAFSLVADARTNKVDVLTGGFSERYLPSGYRAGFYEYANGQWTNFTRTLLPLSQYPNPVNPSRGARSTDGDLYIAAFGGGLLQWKGPGDFRLFTSSVPGVPLLPYGFATNDRVADVAADAAGNVWVTNPHGAPNRSGLFQYAPATDAWTTVPYTPNFENLDRLAIDDAGLIWATVARKANNPQGIPGQAEGGVFAIDPSPNTTNAPRYFSIASGLPDNQIYEVVKDRKGYIWAATIKGVAVFNDANGPFVANTAFTLPYVRRGEGSGFPVLFTEAVRCIAVDGGDRKWMGTDHGLWLFSPDADEALLHFTKANSPLPSDRIVDVKVNDKTGEVWVATDAGVASYRGSATVTEGEPKCAAVFPNPVRPDFAGTVGITGLANNAVVKITDIAGHLVYATKANGGTVTWDLNNPTGQRVRSGLYLVLSSDADGKNTCVSKVAVLSK